MAPDAFILTETTKVIRQDWPFLILREIRYRKRTPLRYSYSRITWQSKHTSIEIANCTDPCHSEIGCRALSFKLQDSIRNSCFRGPEAICLLVDRGGASVRRLS